ncbi:MAG: NADH-quinone oxidoreductase subunit N [Bdellovibrionales bacterium RBG_16_40_8]|nr:MAG: NADH-quinone oxidoreductase subunit N [Bdellovibrionales bacterium RBG_16_40_8]
MPAVIDFSIKDLICASPAIFLFLGSLLPLSLKTIRGNRELNSMVSLMLALFGIVCALAAAGLFYEQQKTQFYAFSGALVFDGVSVFSSMAISIITAVAAIMSREYKAIGREQYSEFLFLLLNCAAGMMILSWANDLIITFIGIEIMSLCLYLIIALSHEERLSKEAAFKYFVLGGFASAFFLYGVALIYGISGTTYINAFMVVAEKLMSEGYLFIFGIAMVAIGFCFKIAVVPFHAWAPDVYEGAPTPVTGFMATGVKLVTFVAFLRFIHGQFLTSEATLITIMQWLAVLTMCLGNIAAIVQNSLKRMLAYSSIAHGGYVMVGLIAASIGGESWRGDLSVIFYMVAYAVMTFGAFGVVCLFEKKIGDMILIDDLKGLARKDATTAFVFTIFLLSLAGIPPLVGFFGKFFIFSAAIKQGLFWLAIWAAVNSVISAYYYLRPIVYMYMKEESGADIDRTQEQTRGIVIILAILVVVLGVAAEPVYNHIKLAISSLQ